VSVLFRPNRLRMPVEPALSQGCEMATATPVFRFISHVSCGPRPLWEDGMLLSML